VKSFFAAMAVAGVTSGPLTGLAVPQAAPATALSYLNAVVVSTDVGDGTVTVRPKGRPPQTLHVDGALAAQLGQLKVGDSVIGGGALGPCGRDQAGDRAPGTADAPRRSFRTDASRSADAVSGSAGEPGSDDQPHARPHAHPGAECVAHAATGAHAAPGAHAQACVPEPGVHRAAFTGPQPDPHAEPELARRRQRWRSGGASPRRARLKTVSTRTAGSTGFGRWS